MSEAVFIYVTHPDAGGAAELGRSLVERGLAACVNILPGMQTIYRWQGAIESGSEVVMIVKTQAALAGEVGAAVKACHPYECPCIAVLPVAGGDPAYLAWIADSCGQKRF